jgi:Domain of unknown function (DUF4926)
MPWNLFDTVKLTEAIPLSDGGIAAVGTVGAIVEVFNEGEAYLVELFGDRWLKYDEQENFIVTLPQVRGAFREPLGVETLYPQQLQLIGLGRETVSVREHLLSLLDKLSEEKLTQVRDFTESLLKK